MQEKVQIENGELKIEDETLQQGNSVRLKGSEIKAVNWHWKREYFITCSYWFS
jgi:hypothetical protein